MTGVAAGFDQGRPAGAPSAPEGGRPGHTTNTVTQ